MQTQIRGFSQIQDGTIPSTKFVNNLNLATAQLAEGSLFLKKDGTVTFAADQSSGKFKLTDLNDAVNAQDALNLRMAEALINGLVIKPSVRAVSQVNIASLSGVATVDGVSLVANDRVLLVFQTNATQNGIWVIKAGAWTRPADFAAGSDQSKGVLVLVAEGLNAADSRWLMTTDGVITVNTTAIAFLRDRGGIVYIDGLGIALNNATNTFSLKANFGLIIDKTGKLAIKLTTDNIALASDAVGVRIENSTPGNAFIANATGVANFVTVTGPMTISDGGITKLNESTSNGFISASKFVYNETVGGAINGVNLVFTLAAVPANSTLRLSLNGNLFEAGLGQDFTIASNNITLLSAPVAGDKLTATYIF